MVCPDMLPFAADHCAPILPLLVMRLFGPNVTAPVLSVIVAFEARDELKHEAKVLHAMPVPVAPSGSVKTTDAATLLPPPNNSSSCAPVIAHAGAIMPSARPMIAARDLSQLNINAPSLEGLGLAMMSRYFR